MHHHTRPICNFILFIIHHGIGGMPYIKNALPIIITSIIVNKKTSFNFSLTLIFSHMPPKYTIIPNRRNVKWRVMIFSSIIEEDVVYQKRNNVHIGLLR